MKENSDIKVCLVDSKRSVIVRGRNGFIHGNVSDTLANHMNQMNQAKKIINFVCLLLNDCYAISDDEGMEWVEINEQLSKELKKKSNDTI